MASGVLNREHRGKILSSNVREDQNRKLLEVLEGRGARAYPEFLKALSSNGYSFLVNGLNKLELTHQDFGHEPKGGSSSQDKAAAVAGSSSFSGALATASAASSSHGWGNLSSPEDPLLLSVLLRE